MGRKLQLETEGMNKEEAGKNSLSLMINREFIPTVTVFNCYLSLKQNKQQQQKYTYSFCLRSQQVIFCHLLVKFKCEAE